MRKIKRITSIILAALMVISLFAVVPISASAAEETSTVTWNSFSGTGGMSSGGVTLTTQQAKTRVGENFYKGRGSATFTAPEGSVFTKIELKNCTVVDSLNFPGATVAQTGGYWQQEPWDDEPNWVQYYTVTWTGESSEVTFSGAIYGIQSIVFTLKSVAPPTYTVTWKNGETTLKTDTVDKDAVPAYNGETPVKAEDANYTYTFSGWTDSSNTFYSKDSALPPVTKDETYTATFASEDKAVKNVIAQINALPAAVTVNDKDQIEAARAAYDALNGDQKTQITEETLDKLTAAETALAAAEKLFPQHSITLGGNIGVNFFINSKTADFASDENAYVKFTWDNGTYNKEVKLKDLTTDADGYYKATVDVVAAQMAHKIHAEVYLNGAKLEQTDDYSVQDYAEEVYNHPEKYDSEKHDELKALAKALLNYGAMAQTVFDSSLKEHPALANKTVGNNGYADVTAEQIGAAINGEASDLNEVATQLGAKYYTNSLIYLSKNTLRIYFTPTSYPGTIPNADKYAGNLSEYYYYVDHANIPAAELDDQQTFTVGGTTFTFSALDYAKAVVNSGMGDDQKNLAKSLYLYNQKANDYFAPKPPTAADALKNDSTVQVKVRVTSNGDWWRTKTWQYNNGTFNQTADVKGTSNALNCSLSASGDIITLRINYNNYSRTVTINTATNTYTETTSGNATWVSRLVWDNFIVNGIDMKPTLTKG